MFVEHKEVGEVTEAPSRPLKLSAAIRIGAALYPQSRSGCYFYNGEACVWGAAAIGFGAQGTVFEINDVASAIHANASSDGAHAAFRDAHGYSMMDANDRQGWTREQIADFLETHGY